MTQFEKTHLMNRPSAMMQMISNSNKNAESGKSNVYLLEQQRRYEYRMQLEYRELDRIARELEKELQKVKEVRLALEKYKIDFAIQVEDEATKKIQEVFKNIEKIIK